MSTNTSGTLELFKSTEMGVFGDYICYRIKKPHGYLTVQTYLKTIDEVHGDYGASLGCRVPKSLNLRLRTKFLMGVLRQESQTEDDPEVAQ